jgi:AraC-like DNA-binding protein
MSTKIEIKLVRGILTNYKESLKKNYSEAPPEINSLLSHLNDSLFERGITIQYIKRRSYSYNNNISTQFSHYIGLSPKKYILKHKLIVARKILSSHRFGELRILSIAIELGFSGTGAFNHAFKKEYKIPPNQWRNINIAERKNSRSSS